MKCVICGNKTSEKIVEHKEFGVLLGKFPAQVCACGEVYYNETTVEKIQEKSKKLGLFGLAKKAKIAKLGNSIAIRIPKEIVNFLNLKKGREVIIFPETKHDLKIHV